MHSLGKFLDFFRGLRDHPHGRVIIKVDLKNHPVLLSPEVFEFHLDRVRSNGFENLNLTLRKKISNFSEILFGNFESHSQKSTAFYFVLESNDSSRFQMKKRAVEELKKDHLKNVRLRAVPMMIKKR